MRSPARVLGFAVPIALVLPVCAFSPSTAGTPGVPIIVTAAPVYEPLAALCGWEHFRKGIDRILAVEESK